MQHAFPVHSKPCRHSWLTLAAVGLATLLLAGCSDEEPTIGPVGPVGPIGPVGTAEIADDAIEGSGNIVAEIRDATAFNRVVLLGEGEVNLTQGETESLTVETDDNLLQYIETSVNAGTLEIRTRPNTDIAPTASVTYRIEVVDLAGVELLGAGSIDAEQLTTGDLNLVLAGTGEIRIARLDGGDLTAELPGVGSVTIGGTVASQVVSVSGVTEYNATDLACQNATVEASGMGSATVWVSDALEIATDDSGSVAYYGSPELTQRSGDLGSVTALGSK